MGTAYTVQRVPASSPVALYVVLSDTVPVTATPSWDDDAFRARLRAQECWYFSARCAITAALYNGIDHYNYYRLVQLTVSGRLVQYRKERIVDHLKSTDLVVACAYADDEFVKAVPDCCTWMPYDASSRLGAGEYLNGGAPYPSVECYWCFRLVGGTLQDRRLYHGVRHGVRGLVWERPLTHSKAVEELLAKPFA
jgi:hypothetical protein